MLREFWKITQLTKERVPPTIQLAFFQRPRTQAPAPVIRLGDGCCQEQDPASWKLQFLERVLVGEHPAGFESGCFSPSKPNQFVLPVFLVPTPRKLTGSIGHYEITQLGHF